jgi:hypothetical protein
MSDHPAGPGYDPRYVSRHADAPPQSPYAPPPVTGPPPAPYAPPTPASSGPVIGPHSYDPNAGNYYGSPPPLPYPAGPPAYDPRTLVHYGSQPPASFSPTVPYWNPHDPRAAASLPAPDSARVIRPGFIVAGIIVAALIAGIAIAATLTTHTSTPTAAGHSTASSANRTLTFPATFANFSLQTEQTDLQAADDIRTEMSADAPAYADAYAHAQVSIYTPTPSSGTRLVVIAMSLADFPNIHNPVDNGTAATIVDGIMLGAKIPNATPVDAGALDGAMRCGTLTTAAAAVPLCAWADQSTFAMVIDATTSDEQAAAATTLALRTAAEH